MKNSINTLLFTLILVICVNQISAQSYALKFDGSNDYVDLGTDAGNSILTVELWFKPERIYNDTLGATASLLMRNDPIKNEEFGLYIGKLTLSGEEGRVVFYRSSGGTKYTVVSDNNSWSLGVWYHVAGTIDPLNGMKLYIDGVMQSDSDPSTDPTAIGSTMTALGMWGDDFSRYYKGTIDEVRMWNRALSQSEIQAKMCDALNPAIETGIVGYWQLDDGLGIVLNDLSGNGYFGFVNGAIWTPDTLCTSTSIGRSGHKKTVGIYPNPFTDHVTIEFDNRENETYSLILYNLMGQIVRRINDISDGKIVIEREDQASGLYHFELHTDTQIVASGQLAIK